MRVLLTGAAGFIGAAVRQCLGGAGHEGVALDAFIPQAHGEIGVNPHSMQGACGLDFEGGPGSCGALEATKDPFGAEPLAAPAGNGSNVAFLDFRRRS